jgi:hypothetical protein
MSDLLGRLISRAKGATPGVEPILTSRYEVPVAFEPPPMAPEAREPRPPSSFSATDEDSSTRPAEVLTERPRRFSSPEESPEARPERNPATKVSVREDRPAPPAHGASARGLQSWAHPVEERAEPDHGEPEGRIEVRVEENEARTLNPPSVTREARAVPTENLPVMVRRDERRLPQSPHSRPPVSRYEASQPVEVQVTIGHIEVRSAPAPPSVAAPKVARPRVAMSLDDYLQRRNGGSR